MNIYIFLYKSIMQNSLIRIVFLLKYKKSLMLIKNEKKNSYLIFIFILCEFHNYNFEDINEFSKNLIKIYKF